MSSRLRYTTVPDSLGTYPRPFTTAPDVPGFWCGKTPMVMGPISSRISRVSSTVS